MVKDVGSKITFVSIVAVKQVSHPQTQPGYSGDARQICLKMYVNGMGFRGIERVTGVHHTTVIRSVKLVGEQLPNAYEPEKIPEVGELDELQTFVGSKKENLDLDSTRSLPRGYPSLGGRR